MKRPLKRLWALTLVVVAIATIAGSAARAATITVCASGCGYTTIQAAINAASSGDVITVAAGTYIEQVAVDKSVTLTGAGSGTTTIQAPAVLTNDPDGAKTVVEFTGALLSAELSGFTIQGPVSGLNFGIYVRDGASANVHDIVVKDIRDNPFSGAQTGVAIEVGKYNDTAPFVNQTGTATITNAMIYGYQKTGIAVEHAGSSATITGSTITGVGPTTVTAQNGIQVRRGATGTISSNTVTGNAWDGPTWSAEGIGALHAGSGVIIQNNTVNHNSANIYVWKSDGVHIQDNQVSDSSPVDQNFSAGITVQSDGTPSCCGGSPGSYIVGLTISGNTIQNNLSGGTTQSDGIDLYAVNGATISNNIITGSGYDGILVGASGNITFTGNTFSQNGNGVTGRLSDHTTDPHAAAIDFGGLQGFAPGTWNGDANTLGGFTVHNNKFTGNLNAIWNYDTGVVDATNNWFGTSAGPGSLTNITTTPWATDSGFTTLSNNADLASLSLSSGTLSPAFSSSTTAYSASVDNGTTSVTVSKTIKPGANAVVSGGSNLSVGANTVTVTVTSADGTTTKTYTITMTRAAPPTPSVTIGVSPVSVTTGAGSTLTWSSSNTTGCTASGNWSGSRTTSGSVGTGALNSAGSYTYSLSCTGPGGTASGSATVTATPPPTPPTNQSQSSQAKPDQPGKVAVTVAPTGTTNPVPIAVTWPSGTFTTPVDVTVTPKPESSPSGTPTPIVGGFTIGSTTVQLTVTDSSGAAVHQFAAPLLIHVSASQAGDVPAYSQDGVTWVTIPQLSSPELPAGQQDGYYRNAGGSIDIFTRHATFFGLLKDTQAPSKPTVKATASNKKLYLLVIGAKDNVRVTGYRLSFNGRVLKSTNRAYVVLPAHAGRYQVQAFDAAGNLGKPATFKVVGNGSKKHPFKATKG